MHSDLLSVHNIFLFNVVFADRRTEIQKSVLEPSCLKKVSEQPKVECSPKKPMGAKVYSCDETGTQVVAPWGRLCS